MRRPLFLFPTKGLKNRIYRTTNVRWRYTRLNSTWMTLVLEGKTIFSYGFRMTAFPWETINHKVAWWFCWRFLEASYFVCSYSIIFQLCHCIKSILSKRVILSMSSIVSIQLKNANTVYISTIRIFWLDCTDKKRIQLQILNWSLKFIACSGVINSGELGLNTAC